MKFIKSVFILSIFLFSTLTFGWTYFFTEDLGVYGNVRRCKYDNGKVYTVNSINLCPMSVNGPGPGMGSGTGFYKGTYLDGITRVCVYDVLGNQRAIRIDSTDICPLNHEFR